MKAFQVKVNGKMLDYRLGVELDLKSVKAFFAKKYQVKRLWSAGRHVVGVLRKDQKEFWLKLATTKGIGVLTKVEYEWNEQFNLAISRGSSDYWVPKNYETGFYRGLFYLITDKFDGQLLVERPEKSNNSKIILDYLPSIIGFAEEIEKLKLCHSRAMPAGRQESGNPERILNQVQDDAGCYREHFFNKTQLWYQDIPENIRKKYQIADLLNFVKNSCQKLQERPRHGDFAPWHLLLLKNGKLGLIDGEHATGNGVENYDFGYFLQRVYSVLEDPVLAKKILEELIKRGYEIEKLKTILAARAIGGFLDEALKEKPNYPIAASFQEFVKAL